MKAVLQNVRRKNIRQIVTGLQGLVEVKVCLTANSLNYCANLLFGERRFFRKIIFFFVWLFGCLIGFVLQAIERSFSVK